MNPEETIEETMEVIHQTVNVPASPGILFATILGFVNLILTVLILSAIVYLFCLLVKALRKYLKSEPVRKENAAVRKSLGVLLKEHRTRCHMTQEFVAEHLCVSRQAVSKWENGPSDPSTSNLLALAKLFGVNAAELLKELQE